MKNAVVIYVTPEYKTLLLKLNYLNRGWASPGGGIDEGEEPFEAAVREMYEETGIHLSTIDSKVIDTFELRDFTSFFVVMGPEVPVTLSDEHTAWTYVPIEEVFDLKLMSYAYDVFKYLDRR